MEQTLRSLLNSINRYDIQDYPFGGTSEHISINGEWMKSSDVERIFEEILFYHKISVDKNKE